MRTGRMHTHVSGCTQITQVIRIDKHDEVPAINMVNNNYHSSLVHPSTFRNDIKPLDVIQAQGPSFRYTFSLLECNVYCTTS